MDRAWIVSMFISILGILALTFIYFMVINIIEIFLR